MFRTPPRRRTLHLGLTCALLAVNLTALPAGAMIMGPGQITASTTITTGSEIVTADHCCS